MKKLLIIFLFNGTIVFCQNSPKWSYYERVDYCLKKSKGTHLPQPTCLIGTSLPSFSAKTIDGTIINKDYFKGKITIINFWFSTCSPCIAEIPGFNIVMEKYGKEKVNYLGITTDSENDTKETIEETNWKFEQISNAKKLITETFKMYWGYPTTFIVDKNGVIIHAFSGGSMGQHAIEKIQNDITPFLIKE